MGPWYANAGCPNDLVLAAAMLRIFGSDDQRSGLTGVYTFKSSDRYLGYAVVKAVWHRCQINPGQYNFRQTWSHTENIHY